MTKTQVARMRRMIARWERLSIFERAELAKCGIKDTDYSLRWQNRDLSGNADKPGWLVLDGTKTANFIERK